MAVRLCTTATLSFLFHPLFPKKRASQLVMGRVLDHRVTDEIDYSSADLRILIR